MSTVNARLTAARAVTAVVGEGRSLRTALSSSSAGDARARALAQSLAYGTLRWWLPLRAVVEKRLRKPLRDRDIDVLALLGVGAYQLVADVGEPHAAVSETAGAARGLGKSWAVGLVNGVLRALQREPEAWPPQPEAAHPGWLRRRLQADWGDQAAAIMAANQTRPPMWLRVNRRATSVADYCEALAQADIQVAMRDGAAVLLAAPVPVAALPGFSRGHVSVQDRAAQLAGGLVDPQPGDRVLDACAAPGGKTAHLLELQPDLSGLVALDHDADRTPLIDENLARLGVRASVLTADAGRPTEWWDGEPFDRILLDAPCSATGVIRRHPDIKLLRKRTDIAAAAVVQKQLLEALWPLLKPGGKLVYATCSVLTDENDAVISAALASQADATDVAIEADWGQATRYGRRIASGSRGMDGFYYAVLRKH